MERAPRLFLSVDVEEWFTSTKVAAFKNDRDFRKDSDIFETTTAILDSFKRAGMVGSFFFIREIAERHPELVERMKSEGHEIALHGENHEHLSRVTDDDFKAMLARSQEFFGKRFGVKLAGYRAPYFSMNDDKLAVLKASGLSYDTSVVPCLPIPGWYGSWRAPLTPYRIGNELDSSDPKGEFLEFPMSVHPTLRIPGLGGYYFRNLGLGWSTHILRSCLAKLGYCMFYIHPWELSDKLPKDVGMPFYMSRRAGSWTREALDRLLAAAKEVEGLKTTTLSAYLREQAAR